HDTAATRAHEPGQCLQQRRFTSAVRSDDGDQLARADVEREPAEDLVLAITGREILNVQERSHAVVPRYASSTRGSRRISENGPSASVRPWAITITGSHSSVTRPMAGLIRRIV